MKKYLFVFLLIFGCCFANVFGGEYAVGSLAGKLNVDHTGSATYTIPIDVPAGTAGMAPTLSIHYNSQTSNGLLGVGFSLQGLTAITRGSSNMAQNGVKHAVSYEYSDVFYLNGQQLVAINGTYGKDQTEYRTYSDSFSKIISYGEQGNGPAKFKVWTKGGQIAEYAFTSDSQVLAQGKSTTSMWLLNKISDTAGNYISISYNQNHDNGSYTLAKIDYTVNDKAGTFASNAVIFNYETREDIIIGYCGGSMVKQDQILKSIEAHSYNALGNQLVYTYDFTYEQSPTYQSRLISIQKSDGKNNELPPTKFQWSSTNDDMGWVLSDNYDLPETLIETVYSSCDYPVSEFRGRFADISGNGQPDYIYSYEDDTTITSNTWINKNDWIQYKNYSMPAPMSRFLHNWEDGHYANILYRGNLVDLNGNGFPDYVQSYNDYQSGDQKHAWLNINNQWESNDNYTLPDLLYTEFNDGSYRPDCACRPCVCSNTEIIQHARKQGLLMDVNGDGLTDFLSSYYSDSQSIDKVWLKTSSDSWSDENSYALPWPMNYYYPCHDGCHSAPAQNVVVGTLIDLNGNGLPDYVVSYDNGQGQTVNKSWLNNGKGWMSSNTYILPYTMKVLNWFGDCPNDIQTGGFFADLNGNGLPDYIASFGTSTSVSENKAWLNSGTGWVEYPNYNPPLPLLITDSPSHQQGVFVDFNGNGRVDYIVSYDDGTGGGKNQVWLNTGSQWVQNNDYALPVSRQVLVDNAAYLDYGFFIDINGNGMKDYVYSYYDEGSKVKKNEVWLNKMPKPDLLTIITDGLGCQTTITYEPLTNDSIYLKGTDGKYPNIDICPPLYVVSQTSSDTGVKDAQGKEEMHVTNYHYAGLKLNRQGWGSLGFSEITVSDVTTGIHTVTTYSQDTTMHNVGKSISKKTYASSDKMIAAEDAVWDLKTFGSGKVNETYYLPFTKQTTKQAYDLNSDLLNTTVINVSIDDYGNPTTVVNTVTDSSGTSYTITTQNSYDIQASEWLLSQLTLSQVTFESTDEPSITKTSGFQYDSRGLLVEEIIEPNDSQYTLTTSYTRDVFGNITKTTVSGKDIEERVTTITYDQTGRFITQKTNALDQSISQVTSAAFGKITSETDLNGNQTTYEYDGFGRLAKISHPDETETTITYSWYSGGDDIPNAVYLETKDTDGTAKKTSYYDKLNRLVAKEKEGFDGTIVVQETAYDNLGRISKKSLPHFIKDVAYCYLYEHDVLGRVTRKTRPDGSITTVKYDGIRTITTNSLGQKTTKIVNGRGKVIETFDDAGAQTIFTYDSCDNLVQVSGSVLRGSIIKMTYDKLGRKVQLYDPNTRTTTYSYDVLGQLLSQKDSLNQTTIFQYDLLGRMISRTSPDGTDSWEYDKSPNGVGFISKTTNSDWSETYEYNELGLQSKKTTTIDDKNYIITTAYDSYSRPMLITYPGEIQVFKTYNSRGFLEKISNLQSDQIYWQLESMDALGRPTKEIRSNKSETLHSYDQETTFLTTLETTTSTATYLQHINYSFDNIGNLASREDNINGIKENFEYNDLNCLTKYTKNDDVTTYSYLYGNMTSNSKVGTYTYGGGSAGPHAVSSIKGQLNANYEYDSNGNQIKGSFDNSMRVIQYTSFNKPKNISLSTGESTAFYYNSNRSRFKRVDSQDGMTTIYLDGVEITSDTSGSTQQKYYIGPYTLLIQDSSQNTCVYELLKDYQGSVVGIVDSTNKKIQSFSYTPFGNQTQTAGSTNDITNEGYIGQEEIKYASLVHMNGRLYDSLVCRFLSADPFIQDPTFSQSLNRYSYCMNNPLAFADPSGYGWFSDIIHGIENVVHDIGRAIDDIITDPFGNTLIEVAIDAIGLITQNYWLIGVMNAAYSAAETNAAGGSFGDDIVAAATAFISTEADAIFFKGSNLAVKGLVHGTITGASQALEGGRFSNGFLAATVTEVAGAAINNLGKSNLTPGIVIARGAAAGVIGGTVAASTGGSFENGFFTSAFRQMFGDAKKAAEQQKIAAAKKSWAQTKASAMQSGAKNLQLVQTPWANSKSGFLLYTEKTFQQRLPGFDVIKQLMPYYIKVSYKTDLFLEQRFNSFISYASALSYTIGPTVAEGVLLYVGIDAAPIDEGTKFILHTASTIHDISDIWKKYHSD